MLSSDLKMSLDPVIWAETNFSLTLDPWQQDALQSTSRRSLWNVHRQGGKSVIASLKGLHKAIYVPGSLILMISPSERQSGELYRKWLKYYDLLDSPPSMPEDKALSCTLSNGSRVVALPDSEDTVRSFSAVSLIIEDESSAVSDSLHNAVRPMLAVSNGELLLMSTPRGKRGHFFEIATNPGPDWKIITVPVTECPRISKEFLEAERRSMPEQFFAQEYLCQFGENVDNFFSYDEIEAACNNDLPELVIA